MNTHFFAMLLWYAGIPKYAVLNSIVWVHAMYMYSVRVPVHTMHSVHVVKSIIHIFPPIVKLDNS